MMAGALGLCALTLACKGKSGSETDKTSHFYEYRCNEGETSAMTVETEPVRVQVPSAARDTLSKEGSIFLYADSSGISLAVGADLPISLSLDSIDGCMSQFQQTMTAVKKQHPDFDIVISGDVAVPYDIFKQLISQLHDIGQSHYKILTRKR